MAEKPDINPTHLKIVKDILLEALPQDVTVWVFGSRAKWTAKEFSDLDLALEGKNGGKIPTDIIARLDDDSEESDLPWKVDVVDINAVAPNFKEIIMRDRVKLDGWGISSEWKGYKLNEVCSVITDGAHQSPKSVTSGLPMASVKDLTFFGVNSQNARLISQDDFARLVAQGCQPKIGDILIAKDGNSALDTVCTVNIEPDYVLLSSVAILRPNSTALNSNFLKYYFRNPKIIKYLKDNFISGAAIPRVVLRDFRRAEINLPEIGIQYRIATILKSFDDKIELNQQMNKTLEEMAQAIFKCWFVDFEPTRAKIAQKEDSGESDADICTRLKITPKILSLFPDTLTNSGLGPIPDSWEVKNFGEVSECFDNKRIPLSKRQREDKKGVYPYFGATSIMDYIDDYLFDKTLVLMGEDGSVLREDGTPFLQYVWGKVWVNNHAHVLRGKNGVSEEHLYIFLKKQNIAPFITGAVQLKLNQGNMNKIPFMFSSDEINQEYSSIIKPMFNKLKCNTAEIETLFQARDSLLPKLLSGEISVGDVGGL